eukprot:scaffold5879_cov81-Phaeocystis_antarctica.AAC.2
MLARRSAFWRAIASICSPSSRLALPLEAASCHGWDYDEATTIVNRVAGLLGIGYWVRVSGFGYWVVGLVLGIDRLIVEWRLWPLRTHIEYSRTRGTRLSARARTLWMRVPTWVRCRLVFGVLLGGLLAAR